MKYAFDIDGTLVTTVNGDYLGSAPITERINAVNRLFDSGHTVVLYTARGSASGVNYREFTENQMRAFGVKFHRLVMGKPDVDMFVDDKAISVEEWDRRR